MTGGREDVTRALAELLRKWRANPDDLWRGFEVFDALSTAGIETLLSDERLAQAEAKVERVEAALTAHEPYGHGDARVLAERVRAALSGDDAAPPDCRICGGRDGKHNGQAHDDYLAGMPVPDAAPRTDGNGD